MAGKRMKNFGNTWWLLSGQRRYLGDDRLLQEHRRCGDHAADGQVTAPGRQITGIIGIWGRSAAAGMSILFDALGVFRR